MAKSDSLSSDPSKADDLLADNQYHNYHYVKNGGDSFGDHYDHNGNSYLKEVHYFHNREVGFEKKRDWDSGINIQLITHNSLWMSYDCVIIIYVNSK